MSVTLPEIFDQFAEQRKQSFLTVMERKETGIPIIGVYCTFFPQELALAIGGTSVSLCAGTDETIPVAEESLPKNMCPLIKASYGFGLTDKCPYFYFSDLVVGETTCDGKKKMYEYMAEFKPVHVMQLPQTVNEEGVVYWQKEIEKMADVLEKQFHVPVTEESLKHAIGVKNRERSAVKDFYELMAADEPPMTGLDMWHVLTGITFDMNKEGIPEKLAALKEKTLAEGKRISGRKRILITGCPIGAATEKVISAVEDNGGIVVAFENCGGAKAIDRNVDESIENPYRALAEKYLNIGCACISPNPNRKELLGRLIDQFKVDGVIDMHLTACTPFQTESLSIKNFCKSKKEIPYMAVETDFSKADVGQLSTRMSAFLEMLP